jgi:hypothetical protein
VARGHEARAGYDGTAGTCQDVTEPRPSDEERAAQREQQVRLEGMLYVARQFADRATGNLAASSGLMCRLNR